MDVEKVITTIKIKLLQRLPWYGHVLSQLPIIYSNKEVPTMGVGKSSKDDILVKLYVNPDYMEKIKEECKNNEETFIAHFTEIFKHEVLHLLFAHLTLDLQDKQRQTMACELSVNSYIDRSKLVLTKGEEKSGLFPEDFKLDSKLGVKEYYDLLNDNKQYQNMMKQQIKIMISTGKNGKGASEQGKGGKSSDSGQGYQIEISTIDDHGKWQPIAGDEMTNEMVKDIIRQANDTCKQIGQWGDIPGEVKQAIDDCYRTKKNLIPWQVVLRNFLASSSENVLDYTMKRKSKRFGTRPGTKKEDILSVAIGIDTSGSISDDTLGLFFSELDWMAKTGTKMTVFEWDTRINKEYDFNDFDQVISGRGGTDPIPVLEEVSKRRFDCLIMFTDMEFADVKEDYQIPILWVVDPGYYSYDHNTGKYPVKDGIIMRINRDRDGFELVDNQ